MGRLVAIKTLTVGTDQDLLRRFRNEAASAGRLRHPNIVTIYDFGEDRGTPFLVMELLEGEDLDRVIANQRVLGLLQRLDIISQAAAGLHHAHSKGILHRDVKPANIMLQNDHVVKIVDFGIALFTQSAATMMTPSGSMIGTPLYMSPEQLMGNNSDRLSDIFAFGVTCYKLLTGIHPFEADTIEALRYNILHREPEPIRALSPECPEALEHAVLRMLSKDREMRYQDLEELRFDLEPIAVELKRERVSDLLSEARELLRARQLEAAQDRVKQVLEAEPANRAARELRETLQRQIREEAIRPRVIELTQEGREHLKARRYEAALEKFQNAQQLDRSNPELHQLLAEARSAAERAQEADLLLKNANDSLHRGDLTAAHAQLLQALAKDPEHPHGPLLRDSIQQSVAARERARRLDEGLSHARRLLVLESYEQAEQHLAQLTQEFPESSTVRELLSNAQREHSNLLRRQRLQAAVAEARSLVKNEQFEQAVTRLQGWVAEYPESTELRDLASFAADELRLLRQARAIAVASEQAQALAGEGKFDEAIQHLRQTLAEYPSATTLRDLIQTVTAAKSDHNRQAALSETIVKARALVGEQRYGEALESLSAYTRAYGESGELAEPRRLAEAGLEQQRRQNASRKVALDARTLLAENKPDSASEILRAGTMQFPEDPELRVLYEEAKERLERFRTEEKISGIIAEAESLTRARQFDKALGVLDAGLAEHPGQDRLLRCRQATLANQHRYDRVISYGRVVESVKSALVAGNFEEAGAKAEAAIADLGEDTVLSDLRERAKAEMEARARAAEVATLAEQGRALLARQEWAAAAQQLEAALRRYPAEARLTKLKAEADAGFAEYQRTANIGAIERDARQAFADGRLDVAFDTVEAGIRRFGREPFAVLREEIVAARAEAGRRESLEALKRGLRRMFEARQYARGLELWTAEAAQFGADAELIELRTALESGAEAERREAAIAALAAEALRLLSVNRPADALKLLEASPQHHGDARVAQALADARRQLAEQHRAQANAEIERQAQELLAAGQYARALEVVEAALKADPQAIGLGKLRERIESAERQARDLAEATRLAEAGETARAWTMVQAALAISPGERAWLALKTKLDAQQRQQREAAEVAAGLTAAEAQLNANRPDEALAGLRPLARKYPAEERLRQLMQTAEKELHVHQRERDLAAVKDQAERLVLQQKYAEALALVNARFPGEPRFRELVAGAEAQLGKLQHREGFERAWNRLLAIEQRVPITPRSKLKRLSVELRQAVAGYEAEPQLAELTKRIDQQIEEALNAPAPPPTPIPWRPILGGGGLIAVALAGVLLVPRLFDSGSTIGVEIRTEPPGAQVSIAGRTCVAPECRFDLPAGRYPVEAVLSGHRTARQEFVVDASHRTTVLRLEAEAPPEAYVKPKPETPQANLTVMTGVDGARVLIDGRLAGETSDLGVLRVKVELGKHEVRVSKVGYQLAPAQQVAATKSADPYSLRFKLLPEPLVAKSDPPKVDPRSSTRPSPNRRKPIRRKTSRLLPRCAKRKPGRRSGVRGTPRCSKLICASIRMARTRPKPNRSWRRCWPKAWRRTRRARRFTSRASRAVRMPARPRDSWTTRPGIVSTKPMRTPCRR